FHILQHDRRRTLQFDDGGKVEEKVALGGILEAVRAAKTVLLRDPGNRKRLARKARREHVVVGDVRGRDLRDVTVRNLAKPGLVGLLAVAIPLGGKQAMPAGRFQTQPESA